MLEEDNFPTAEASDAKEGAKEKELKRDFFDGLAPEVQAEVTAMPDAHAPADGGRSQDVYEMKRPADEDAGSPQDANKDKSSRLIEPAESAYDTTRWREQPTTPELSESDDTAGPDESETRPRVLVVERQTEVEGPFEITESMLQEADAMFRSPEGSRPFDGQVELTDERWGKIEKLQGAVQQVAADAGVDISDRFLLPEEHHVFAATPELHAALREAGEVVIPETEGSWTKHGLFLLEGGNPTEEACDILHETAHSVSRRGIEGAPEHAADISDNQPRITIEKLYNGYREQIMSQEGEDDVRGAPLNEMVADMMAIHAATKYTDVRGLATGYGELLVVGYELIEGAADLRGEAPLELLRHLERGLLVDDDTGLRALADYMGERNFRVLTMLSPSTPGLAHILGMPTAARKFREGQVDAFRPAWLLNS